MAKTPEESIAFRRKQAERTKQFLDIAKRSADHDHAAFLIRGLFRDCLMEGLIRWRCSLGSPVAAIKEAVRWIRDGAEFLTDPDGVATANEIVRAQASILCYLLNEPPIAFDPNVLKMDCLLGAAFNYALRDQWDEPMWAEGLSQLQSEGRCALSIETYSTYYRLLRSQGKDVEELVQRATALFENRKDDEFYIGGPQTEGGDLDNMVTVDYRLAAILRKLHYEGENIHRWRWD